MNRALQNAVAAGITDRMVRATSDARAKKAAKDAEDLKRQINLEYLRTQLGNNRHRLYAMIRGAVARKEPSIVLSWSELRKLGIDGNVTQQVATALEEIEGIFAEYTFAEGHCNSDEVTEDLSTITLTWSANG